MSDCTTCVASTDRIFCVCCSSSDKIWDNWRQISKEHPDYGGAAGYTHQCVWIMDDGTICGHLIKVKPNYKQGSNTSDPWSMVNPQHPNTQARRHNQKMHGATTDASVRADVTKLSIVAGNVTSEMSVTMPRMDSKLLQRWVLDGAQRRYEGRWGNQKLKQLLVCWYVYSPQRISKETFDDEDWREMMYSADTNFAVMSKADLEAWVRAEFEFFEVIVEYINDSLLEEYCGNACSQFFHDGITLANGNKYQMQGLQFVWADVNWTISLYQSLSADALVAVIRLSRSCVRVF